MTRRLELEKRRLLRLEKELSLSRKTVSVKMGMLNPPSSTPKNGSSTRSSVPGEKDIGGGASETQRRVRPQSLSRFDTELKKLNEVKHSNKMMRVQIDGVRKERLHLNRVFEKLKTEIKQRAEQLLEFVEETQSSQRVYDEADQRMTAMRRQRETDRSKFKEKVLKIRSALRDNEFERQELEVELKRADAGVQRKKVLIIPEEEKDFSENAMIRRIMKTAFLNCIQRRHIKQHQKSIMVFEQAFATIKQTTCISNIEEIVRIFVQLESRNYSLLTYVNHMNREMDHLAGLQRERKELEAYANEGHDYQEKLQALAETKRAVGVATAALKTSQETHAKQTKITNDIKPLLAEIVGRLQDEVRTLREAGSTCFGDELRKLPNEMRDESLPTFLEWVEVVMSRFRDLIPTLPEKEPPFPPTAAGTIRKLQAKRFGVTPTLVKAQDLPSASLQGDEAGGPTKRLGGTAAPKTAEDDEEDEDKDFNEKPLSLKDIRERAEKALRRRKRAAPRSSLVNIFDIGSLGVTGPGSPNSAVQAHHRQKADSPEAEDEDSGSGTMSDSGSIADSGQEAEALETGGPEEGEDAS